MGIGKGAYLKRITSGTMKWRTVDIGEKMDGTSPPSVFIGQADYPKVQVGPMMAPFEGHTEILDTPESWIPMGKTQEDIIQYRLNLVRGKHRVDINDVEGNFVRKLQEISLAEFSVQSEARFTHKPRGVAFDEEHQPYGPSAQLKSLDVGNARWDRIHFPGARWSPISGLSICLNERATARRRTDPSATSARVLAVGVSPFRSAR